MLDVRGLHVHYGNIHALQGVTLEARPQEIVALIGGNGAGKTTLLNVISGLHRSSRGAVLFEGKDVSRMPPARIVGLGIVQVPEGRQVFAPLSLQENLEMGAYVRYSREKKGRILADMEEVFGLFPPLKERRAQAAGTLSGGEQQMLAIGRGLMARPRLVLLDEPSLGLAPLILAEIFRVIETLPGRGTTVLLVEQNARAALRASHRGYVLETGCISLGGESETLLEDERIKRAFLGRERQDVPTGTI